MTDADYVRQVDWALRDLPWRERRDLIADLRGHLAELPPATDLVARLGTPEHYAADLRAAEGLERHRGPVAYLRARRPRSIILVVLMLVVAGLAIAAVVSIQTYQPLVFGGMSHFPPARDGAFGDEIKVRAGAPFVFGMEIVNRGRFAVRVLGVPYEPAMAYPWKAHLMMGPLGKSFPGETPSQRFTPFDLHPGEHRVLFLKGVFVCRFGWKTLFGFEGIGSSFPVRYSFLWHDATAEIPFPKPVAFSYNRGDGCHK